ncbi:alpha/beta fold hydrolase [Natrarchaeobius chitinivorans]|uniref:Alpha/beta hydrolase n=1 Tax=Natrarchaeobius chitinivorans TaxID=1679083 RepID=A0A3N6LRH1_NATCH|nr:alpha/beta hydrolase [Natrarchaeobius chitinivorans]RQG92343.1 alpha/beta hydrolase [Natrarchaeobius chitinivorans]
MPYVQCNGADLYYEDHGEGPPIIFLHGVMCGLRFFEPQLAGLSNEYRTVAVDFRGHGRSEKIEVGHTVAQYARDLHTFLKQRDLEDVVLVGWSMGAFVSWDYVDQFDTERVLGLVNVDIEASRFQWDDYDYGLTDLEGLEDTLALVQEDQTTFINRLTEQVFSNPTTEMRTLQFDETSRTPTPIKSAILFDALTRDYRAVLPKIDVPMLVCAGADETRGTGTVAAVRHVADLVPEATFELFEGCGHCPPIEQPGRFNRVVSQFIETL